MEPLEPELSEAPAPTTNHATAHTELLGNDPVVTTLRTTQNNASTRRQCLRGLLPAYVRLENRSLFLRQLDLCSQMLV